MQLVGVSLLKCLIFTDRLVFFSLQFIFVWLTNTKFHYTEKDSVVLYHAMICCINLLTIIFTHLRKRQSLKLFVATFSFFYVTGFALLTLITLHVSLKNFLFPVAFFSLVVGFAGTKCFLTDLLRMQISDPAYNTFCFISGVLLLLCSIAIGATWPYVLDRVPLLGQPDSYYVSFAGITCLTLLLFLTFNLNLLRNVYTVNANLRRETNFKYMLAVLFAPLYYAPKYFLLHSCLRISTSKRHRSALRVGAYFKFALYVFSPAIVSKMVRIWRIVYLIVPLALYWAVTEQQHARLVFTTYHTDRRFQLADCRFYLHPTQMQLLNPISHLLLLPLLCYIVYPAMRPWPKRDRILNVGSLMSFALYLSATIAYRQTRGNTQALTSKPQTIVTNVVSGLEVNSSMFAKYDIRFGIESKRIEPFSGSAINAPVSNPKVYVNFTMDEESPLEDFSIRTENLQDEFVQTLFFRRKHQWGRDSLEIFRYQHDYIRPYDFTPTFRVYFANVTPLHEVSLLTPLGHRWLSIPMDSTPDVEYHIEPGHYRFTINNYAAPHPTIVAEYGAYYDAVVFTNGDSNHFVFTTKLGRVRMHGSQMFFVYMLLIVPEVIYWFQALRLFMYQAPQPEITQTVVMWWYFMMALANFIVVWINEMGIGFYKFDDYQFFFGFMLQIGRWTYPFMAHWYRPLPGTD